MASAGEDIAVLGEVTGAYGVRGWIKVRPYTAAPDALLAHGAWWLQRAKDAGWSAFARRDGRLHSGTLVVELEGLATREAALELKGARVGVPRSALPAAGENEYFWDELTGFTVINRAGVLLGAVTGLVEHGAHPLLEVARPRETPGPVRLIPFVPAIIGGIDRSAGRIDVDWGVDF